MFGRISAIALNTYREAVRARVLHGLFALALGTAAYALVVGVFALRNTLRVTSDLGSASISLYALIVAVVMGATSLHRELELKTIFPILARPIRRGEYLVGKFLGTWLTLWVFVLANAGVLMIALGQAAGRGTALLTATIAVFVAAPLLAAWRLPRARTWLPVPWAVCLALVGYWLAAGAVDDRRVVVASSLLALAEVAVIIAVALVFSSFSSPFLTAVFTFGVLLVGRSADTLATLPERTFGAPIKALCGWLARVVPNLMVYVPPRPLLTGEAASASLGGYLALAAAQSAAWCLVLLALASVIFRRRDFL